MLLLLNWEDTEEKGVAPTKMHEYLATSSPILASGGFGGDYVESLLSETKEGTYCRTKPEVLQHVNSYYT